MPARKVAILRIQKRPTGGFQVTVPKKGIASVLRLKHGDSVEVYFDEKRRQWTYRLLD